MFTRASLASSRNMVFNILLHGVGDVASCVLKWCTVYFQGPDRQESLACSVRKLLDKKVFALQTTSRSVSSVSNRSRQLLATSLLASKSLRQSS